MTDPEVLKCDACHEPAKRMDYIEQPGTHSHEVSMKLCSDHDGHARQFHNAATPEARSAAKAEFNKGIKNEAARVDSERLLARQRAEFNSRNLSWRERHPNEGRSLGRSL